MSRIDEDLGSSWGLVINCGKVVIQAARWDEQQVVYDTRFIP